MRFWVKSLGKKLILACQPDSSVGKPPSEWHAESFSKGSFFLNLAADYFHEA
jgi:hypothetical protein